MIIKYPMLIAVFLNLIAWNYYISGSWGSFFSVGHYIVVHLTTSCVVVLLLWLLSREFLRLKKLSHLLLLSMLVAYLTAVITMCLFWMAPQLLVLDFEGLSALLPAAVLMPAISFYYWVPLGIVNYYLLRQYSKKVRSLSDTAKLKKRGQIYFSLNASLLGRP